MKRPSRLERALEHLARDRKHVQRDLAEVSARRARMARAIDRLNQCRETIARTDPVGADGLLNRDLYLVARTAEARMTQEMAVLDARLERFDREITHPVRERLRAAVVRERAVETLIMRRREEVERDERRRDVLAMDEHARISSRGRDRS